jgi:UDP-N-acetyl-D-glucosamine dehydrogenase
LQSSWFYIDPAKISKLAAGQSYIKHIPSAEIAAAVSVGVFDGTTGFRRVGKADALILGVPTPLNKP